MPLLAPQHYSLSQQRDAKISQEDLTFADYFAGIGLVRLGLERAGWNALFANDWAAKKCEMYSAHFRDTRAHYLVQDIFSICPTVIPRTLLATASFPCIDLSLAGNLKGIRGQHSSAFWGFVKILKSQTAKPRLVMLENVVGWFSSNQGQDFRITIQALNRLGYVCDVFAIDAAHFVPQSRPRIFVIGIQACKANQDIFKLAQRHASLKTRALEKAIAVNSDLQWNFLGVPALPEKVTAGLGQIVERISDDDERWWSEDEVQRHLSMMSPLNLDYIRKLQNLSAYAYCTMYRRVRGGVQRAELRKDGIAGCLRTVKGGSSRQMLVRAGKGTVKMRVMTPREYARLQGVPDDYPMPSQINQALTGFGDAVCVPVVTWIALNILNPLVKSIPEKLSELRH
ncbi:MAG: DNA (cytosine-5-)-methyltransferase [Cyanobacteria bacterium J06635_15]